MSDFNLGTATAYGYAKDKGYTGTEEEFAELMASYASVAESAAASAEAAAASATTATTKASEASASATTATTAKTAAETAATTATTKAGEASTSATTASTKAGEASTSASTASTKATEASNSATSAAGSATTASTKAGEAATYATNAAASATAAAQSAATLVIDATLTHSGQAADAKATGDAITALNEELNNIFGLSVIPMQGNGQYIKTNGSIGTTVNLTPSSSSGFKYAIVNCQSGDTFTINATGGNSPRTWCFCDSNNVILDRDGTANNTVTNLILTAPTNTAKLIINDNSGSTSYVGSNADYKQQTEIDLLMSLTGGSYSRILQNADLNSYLTPGNYYCQSNAHAATLSHCPVSSAFKMQIDAPIYGSTSYYRQTLRPYTTSENSIAYVRTYTVSSTTWTDWVCVATTGEASTYKNGLMSAADKAKVDAVNYDNFGDISYPSVIADCADLLEIEKTWCILHDNFSRSDNATAIGSNGSISGYNMDYTDMASSSTESNNIKVGISSYKAVASNPNSVSNAYRFKVKDCKTLPLKIAISFDTKGIIVLSPINTSNYIKVTCTANEASVEGVGTVDCTSASVTHNGGVTDAVAYLYPDKVQVFIAGEKIIDTPATPVNAVCGLYFSSADISDIAYTNVDIFVPDVNIPIGIDNAVENCASPSSTFLGLMNTADASYGITFDDTITNNSFKSLRFEQRKVDSTGGTYRSEISPPYMRRYNYNLQTKILDYDLYFPSDYDYDSYQEILWQQHHTPDSVNPDAMYPNIAFRTYQNKMQICIRSYARKASDADDAPETIYDIGTVEKEKWMHFTVFIREGYLASHNPCVAVWVDGELKLLTRIPNAYNTKLGSYLKMGMYKAVWVTTTTENATRTIYYDNLKIWQ